MDIIDLTSGGYVYRWSLVAGYPRCVDDAIPASSAGALPALQRNAAIRAALAPAIAYEAAQRLVARGEPDNGQPKQMQVTDEDRPVVEEDGAPVMVDNPAWSLPPRTRTVTDPMTGEATEQPDPLWGAYDAAVALIAAASPVTEALVLWRTPESQTDVNARLEWLAAKQLVEAAIEDAAETPLEFDPRPVPKSVPLWRAKAVLANMGLLDEVDMLIAAQPQELRLYWSFGTDLDRGHPLLAALAASSGFETFTPSAIDGMFRAAEALGI